MVYLILTEPSRFPSSPPLSHRVGEAENLFQDFIYAPASPPSPTAWERGRG